MWVSKNLSKLGLLVSFISAIAYEMTGANFLKAISLSAGVFALSVIISHNSNTRYISRVREHLHYLRLLK